MIAIDCNGLFLLIFEEKWPNYTSGSKIRTKQWLVLVVLAFQCMCAGFLCPKCKNFACLHTRQDQNELHGNGQFFLPKSSSFVSRSQVHLEKRKRIGWSIGVIPRSLCKIRLNDVSEVFNCWEGRWIDVDGSSHTLCCYGRVIFSGVCTIFGFSRFGLSMRMPEKWPNYDSGPKSAPNSDSFLGASAFQCMRAGFLRWFFFCQNRHLL